MSNNYANLRGLKRDDPKAAKRCAMRLLDMRKSLAPLRKRKSESSLLLATWNIRDFDSNAFGFGPRRPETFFYIAEILSCFDLIAVQEVSRDLSALEQVMRLLGREWDYIATDTTEGVSGNGERMVFVFNREKVSFRKIAGEVVLPSGQLIMSPAKVKTPKDLKAADLPTNAEVREATAAFEEVGQQFARTPFLVAFQSGWFRFSLCTVHIYYGSDSGERLKRRIGEIEKLVKFFADRQDVASKQEKDHFGAVENYILLGDFNVVSPSHKTMEALKGRGFMVPAAIDGKKVRKLGDHFYDQIAVRVKDSRFSVLAGGMVDIYADVFRDDATDRQIYKKFIPKKDPEKDPKYAAKTPQDLYRKWRTWQMSDHSPLWIEIDTDYADDYIGGFAKGNPES